jgi:hypothetical protein
MGSRANLGPFRRFIRTQRLCNLAIDILMGCIHNSQTLPKHRDQKGEKAERPGIIWKLIRRFRKAEVIAQKEPFMVFTDTAVDNIIPHQDILVGPCKNEALQLQVKPGPQQDDLRTQQTLVPWHQSVLQDDHTSQQTVEDLNHREDDFSQDIVIDSLCEAGPLEHYIVNAYLNEIDSQLSQKTGEEANGDFNGREDDLSQEITLDSLCEAGPLEHYIVNAYLNEIGP